MRIGSHIPDLLPATARITFGSLGTQKALRLKCSLVRQSSADTTGRLLSRLLESSPHIVYKSGEIFFQQCGVLCHFFLSKSAESAGPSVRTKGGAYSLCTTCHCSCAARGISVSGRSQSAQCEIGHRRRSSHYRCFLCRFGAPRPHKHFCVPLPLCTVVVAQTVA